MFFKRDGFPGEGDLLLCTVKKILFHSVFVSIDEYRVLEGMVHISEVAPGRIRNLRDYVREGKQIICKVIRVDDKKGHVDLSLRRVNPSARSKKLNEYKQEERAEKILEQAAKRLGADLADAYKKAGEKIIGHYGLLTPGFYDVLANGDKVLSSIKVPDDYAKAIAEVVREKMTLPEVTISGYLNLQSFSDKGVLVIKDALAKATDFAKKNSINAEITYIGAPLYQLNVKSSDYKSAEEKRDVIVNLIVKEMLSAGGTASFSEKKK